MNYVQAETLLRQLYFDVTDVRKTARKALHELDDHAKSYGSFGAFERKLFTACHILLSRKPRK